MGRRENPYKENSFDGVSLNPLEVMFVKVKGYLLELDWTTATWADAIDRWMHHKVCGFISSIPLHLRMCQLLP